MSIGKLQRVPSGIVNSNAFIIEQIMQIKLVSFITTQILPCPLCSENSANLANFRMAFPKTTIYWEGISKAFKDAGYIYNVKMRSRSIVGRQIIIIAVLMC